MNVALGITGCIAAYKAIEVMRGLQKAGVSVQTILTQSATKFVTPLTLESLSGQEVLTDMFKPGLNREIEHIRVAQWLSVLAVVPATANILAKMAHGIADDFLTTVYVSNSSPVVFAPAMNVDMWNHPSVQNNVTTLKARGHVFVNPEPGLLACGMEGEGRLAEVEGITDRILARLVSSGALSGIKILVTAGPTIEDLDPVRYLSNRSSGKMGYALAEGAYTRGADVILVTGPTNLDAPHGVRTVRVRSASEMHVAVMQHAPEVDVIVKAAAVADFRPVDVSLHKIKKEHWAASLALERTDDILGVLGSSKQHQLLIGFAAETENLIENARLKLKRKNLDIVIANDVSAGIFGSDSATVHIIDGPGPATVLREKKKAEIANHILDMVQTLLATSGRTPVSL